MPQYLNTGESRAVLPGWGGINGGQVGQVSKYVILPDDSPFELYSHEPFTKPVEKLHAGTLPVAILSGLAKYAQVEIVNESGAAITVVFNADTTNAYVISSGNFRTFDSNLEIEALSITGSGGGNVYVYGFGG